MIQLPLDVPLKPYVFWRYPLDISLAQALFLAGTSHLFSETMAIKTCPGIFLLDMWGFPSMGVSLNHPF